VPSYGQLVCKTTQIVLLILLLPCIVVSGSFTWLALSGVADRDGRAVYVLLFALPIFVVLLAACVNLARGLGSGREQTIVSATVFLP
jgi:hypothetical protein